MPRAKSTSKRPPGKLSRLPRDPDLVIEGGFATLPLYVREGSEIVQPRTVIWADSANGLIRSLEMIGREADASTVAIQSLRQAFAGPFLGIPQSLLTAKDAEDGGEAGADAVPLAVAPALPARVLV